MDTHAITIKLAADIAELQSKMRLAPQLVGGAMTSIEKSTDIAKKALMGLTGALSVTALVAWSKATIDAADAANDLSQRVGISVKDLAKYELAAAQSGTTMEALAKGIKGIAGNLQEHGAALKKAGIDATTADGAMQQLADVFADMPDGMEKTTLAVKLFGKSGMDLIPMLNLGSAGLKTAAEKSAAYAEQMAVMAPLADAVNDNLATLAMQSRVSGMVLLNELMPSLVYVSAAMADVDKGGNTLASTFGQTINTAFEAAVLIASDVIFTFRGVGREIGGIMAQINALGEGGGVFSAKGRAAWTAVGDAMKEDAIKAREDLDRWQENLVSRTKNTGASYNQRQGFGESAKSTDTGLALLATLGTAGKTAKEAISEATKGLNLYLELMDKGAGFEKSWAKDVNELRAALDGKTISQDQYNAAVDQLLKKQPLMVEAEKLRLDLAKASAKAVDEYTKHLNEQMDAEIAATQVSIDYAAAMAGINQATELELSMAGMTEQQRAIATKNRQIDLELEKQIAAIHKTNAAADVQAAQIAAVQATAASQRNRTANDVYRADWVKTATTIQDTLTDAFMGAIDNGKSLFVNLRDSVVGMFKNMVLRPMIQATVGSAMGMGASGAAMAGESGGNLLGVAGNLGSLYNTIAGGFTGLADKVAFAANDMGAWMVNNTTGMLNQAGSSLMQSAGSFGTVAGYAAGAAAGLAVGNAISGQFGSSNTVTAGTIIGSVVGGPIGGAIGGAIAGLVNRAFGMGNAEVQAQGTRGTFAASGDFSGQNYATMKQDGGWFSSDRHWTETSALDTKTAQSWSDAFAGIKSASIGMASTLGLATDKIAAYTKYIDIAAGTTAEQMTALFTGMADDMATATAPGLAALSRVGEASSATLARLSSSLVLANQWLANFNQTLLAGSLAGGDAASKLVDTFGGADKFAASQSAYYAAMYTEAERLAKTTENVAKGLALVGQAMPSSIEDFNKLRDGISLTSEEGRNAYAVMTALGPEFAQVANAAKAAAASIASEHTRLQDQYDALTMTSTQLLEKQRNALDASNRGLFDQVTALEAQKTAQEDYKRALESTQTAIDAAASALDAARAASATAKSAVDAIHNEATSNYLSAADKVAQAQQRIADITANALNATEQAAINAAEKMRDVGKSLREFVEGKAKTPDQAFADTLKKALAGDTDAMQGLTGAATAASDLAAERSVNVALTQARIMADVMRVAAIGEGTSVPAPTKATTDDLIAAQADLQAALVDQTTAQKLANSVGASLSAAADSLAARYAVAVDAAAVANQATADARATLVSSLYQLEAIKENTAPLLAQVVNGFDAIDKNTSGTLTLAELKAAGLASDSSITNLFNLADANGDNVLTKLEAIRANTLLTAEKVGATVSAAITSANNAGSGIDSEMGLAGLTSALKASATTQGVDQSKITSAFSSGLFSQLDANSSGGLSAAESSAAKISSAVAGLLTQTSGGSGASGVGAGTSEAVLSAYDRFVLASPGEQLGKVITPAEKVVEKAYKDILYSKPAQAGLDWWEEQYNSLISDYGLGAAAAEERLRQNMSIDPVVKTIHNAAESQQAVKEMWLGKGMTDFGASTLAARYFANGGVFTNGIATRPTNFSMGQMGEAGPEAIMPLANINGSLGVRFAGNSSNDALVAEIRRLRESNERLEQRLANIEAAARSSAVSNANTADSTRTLTRDGVQVWTDPADPIKVAA